MDNKETATNANSQVTLIKQPKLPQKPQDSTANVEKKVVKIKKKVVVGVKPVSAPAPVKVVVAAKPAEEQKQEESVKPEAQTAQVQPSAAAPAKPAAVKEPQKPAARTDVKPAVVDPLRNGPVIIRGSNLPPIKPAAPGTGARTSAPRQAGVVGGKDFSGNRKPYPQRRPEGQGNRPGFAPSRSFTGQNGRGYASKPGNYTSKGAGNSNFAPKPGFGPKPQGAGGFRRPGSDAPSMGDSIGKTKRDFSKKGKDNESSWRKEDREKEFQYDNRKGHASSASAVPKSIDILENVTVNELAKKMNLKATDIISKLFAQGMMVTINDQIDADTATLIASEYGCEVHIVNLYDETVIPTEETSAEDEAPRAPIVTVMGHVDHGKTKLLDAIRSTKVAESEFGGITQHIGAYKVSIPERGDVVFLDTPGHAAFSMMRARGAQITDIVVLVVAANDGVMPQTLEAIDHAKAAKVPIIVAINKCDLSEANPDRVMQQLSTHDLVPEEWGGTTLYCKISALKKQGIDDLLETILLQAEMLDLKAVHDCRAEGSILESRIDPGRGSVATIMVKKGTLKEGDYYVAGVYSGRVRAMFDDRGKRIKKAGPSSPVEISGLSGLPGAGDPFQVTEDEKQARLVGNKRQELERLGQAKKYQKTTLENLYQKIQEGTMKELQVIIKSDVQGSAEALQKTLEELSNDEIRLNVIRASAGAIIENDITLAAASENHAIVIGFNVRPTPKALALAEQEKIEIKKYNVIYDAVDDIKAAMEGMLAPEKTEVDVGTGYVKQVFMIPKVGPVAGVLVNDGVVRRNCLCRVIRDSYQLNRELVKITSLKRFKDDAKEVTAGFECGIGIEGFDNLKEGDILEFVEIKEVKRTLEDVAKAAEKKAGK